MELSKIIEKEELELDSMKLNKYQREIKETFKKEYDRKLQEFLKNNSLTEKEVDILKEYNAFLKEGT